MDARVIVLRDTNGAAIRTMDVSDLDNANAAAPLALTIEARCDLGEWHQGQRVEVSPWGSHVADAPAP